MIPVVASYVYIKRIEDWISQIGIESDIYVRSREKYSEW